MEYASKQLKKIDFEILDGREALIKEHFRDIGVVVFYLRIISWQIPNFIIEDNIRQAEVI